MNKSKKSLRTKMKKKLSRQYWEREMHPRIMKMILTG